MSARITPLNAWSSKLCCKTSSYALWDLSGVLPVASAWCCFLAVPTSGHRQSRTRFSKYGSDKNDQRIHRRNKLPATGPVRPPMLPLKPPEPPPVPIAPPHQLSHRNLPALPSSSLQTPPPSRVSSCQVPPASRVSACPAPTASLHAVHRCGYELPPDPPGLSARGNAFVESVKRGLALRKKNRNKLLCRKPQGLLSSRAGDVSSSECHSRRYTADSTQPAWLQHWR